MTLLSRRCQHGRHLCSGSIVALQDVAEHGLRRGFCQDVCLVNLLLLNTAINVVTYGVYIRCSEEFQIAHYAGECSRWTQHVALLLDIVQKCTSCKIVSCLQGVLRQLSYGCLKLMASLSYWDLGRWWCWSNVCQSTWWSIRQTCTQDSFWSCLMVSMRGVCLLWIVCFQCMETCNKEYCTLCPSICIACRGRLGCWRQDVRTLEKPLEGMDPRNA